MLERDSLDYRTVRGLRESNQYRVIYISFLAAVVGVAAGFVAYALYALIALLSNLIFFQEVSLVLPSLQHHNLGALVIIVPVIGGLIVGIMAKYGSPKIIGHGIPEAMEAVLTNRSRISPRVAILKPISAAIAIGTGGPFGAEGPIIQTGGALGSLLGQFVHTTAVERKVLLACGAAAGMAATFGTPIAAVILAIELLLFEFKSRSFIPLVIASTLATTIHYYLFGRGPLFEVGPVDFGIPSGIPYYILLGILCGAVAVAFSNLLYIVEDWFEELPVDRLWLPAIGALGLGIIGYFVPRVLGVGYETISEILNNRLPLTVLFLVMIFKALALLVSLGSGTSGGLLAPMFMFSAAMGGIFAILINQVVPGANLAPGAYALVAMAAVFGAASRSTFAFIIFAFEITRDYNAILPLMLVCVIADIVALFFMRNTIMTEKLARRGLRVNQDYEVDVLQQATVGDVMDPAPVTIKSDMLVSELMDRIAQHDPVLTRHQALPILDSDGRLAGIITRGDILAALEQDLDSNTCVVDVGANSLVVTYKDELLSAAVDKMLQHDIGRLLVVDRKEPQQLLGYLSRGSILRARQQRLRDEHLLEQGWLWSTIRRVNNDS